MEIGPGPGALTNIIRSLPCRRLLLLEKDDHYAALHASIEHPGQEVLHGDAMLYPWESLAGEWKVVSNLPYNVASPLMWDIVSKVSSLRLAVFMIQKEVADRILAAPGSKTYGGLSVWMQSFARIRRGLNVAPGSFSPPPKVDSSVIVITPLAAAERPQDPAGLSRVIKACFGLRRKQLGSILLRCYPEHDPVVILHKLGIDPKARPETLSPGQFQQLAQALGNTCTV